MIQSAEVYLWGSRIGLVYQGESDPVFRFEYDRSFQKSGIELAPFQMPLSDRVYTFPELSRSEAFRGMPGLLADSLPDRFGNAVIDRWLTAKGREPDSFTAIERLCYTGTRGMGALEYVPAQGPHLSERDVDVQEMVKLASEILQDRKEEHLEAEDMSLLQLLEIGSSAGGARAKAVIAWNEATGEIRSGQIDAGSGYEYWLLKFDGISGNGDHGTKDPRQYTRIEYAYYLMAGDLGIPMEECRLLERDGLAHFMTKRFDRKNGKKIHTQTLAALGHFDYNMPGLCSYEQYAEYAKKLGMGKKEMEQIYRCMVFGDLSRNYDDHVKNFSFRMDPSGTWSLAPAYDLCFAYNPGNRWISGHQMRINGKMTDIQEEDLLAAGKTIGLNTGFCKKCIAGTKDVLRNWMDYAERSGINEARAEELRKYLLCSPRP